MLNKLKFTAIVLFMFITPALANAPGMPDTLTILGKPMVFREQIGNEMIAYYAETDQEDYWTMMFTVSFKTGKDLDSIAEAKKMQKSLNEDKVKPLYPVDIVIDETKREAFLGVVAPGNSGDGVMYSVIRYIKAPNGVVSYSIDRYIHKDEKPQPDIAALQKQMLEEIKNPNFPMPDAAKK